MPGEVVIDRATNEGDGVGGHAHVGHLDRYAFGVTKVKGVAGRYLDLDLDVFRGTSLIRRLHRSGADVHRRTTAQHRAVGPMAASVVNYLKDLPDR